MRYSLVVVMIGILTAVMTSCGGQYGHLRLDGEARKIFDEYRVLPDHNYYYSGSSSKPRAIIGIHEDYRLESNLWKPVDLTPEQLKKWMRNINPTLGRNINNIASVIVNPAGETVGIWYSKQNRTTIQFKEGNVITVNPPSLDTEDRFRKNSR
jgi:hypothetical protein